MSNKHLHAFLAIVTAACLTTSCRSDLNLSTVDTAMEVHLGMALPVGTISMKFGNLLQLDSSTTITIDTIGNQGVLSFNVNPEPDTTRRFSIFDFGGKIKGVDFPINMYDHLNGATYVLHNPLTGKDTIVHLLDLASALGDTAVVLPYECSFDSTMVFNLKLPLSAINHPGDHERVDSISFSETNFSVSISKEAFEGIDPTWIDSIVLELSDEFDLHGGSNKRVIYPTSSSSINFGQEIPFQLDNLTMKFMKKEDEMPSFQNIKDTVHLSALIKYHVPGGTIVAIHKNSKLNCKFSVGKLEPTYIWGWFTPYKDMYDAGKFALNINFDDMPFLKDPETVLPFSRPELTATVRTQVAGVIKMDGDYMKAYDMKGRPHYAQFGDSPTDTVFHHIFPADQCIDPKTMASVHDTTHLSLTFDKNFGHIHNLFEGGIPKEVEYKFLFEFDSTQTPQIRIPMNTFVHLYTKAKLPFTFQKGFYLKYERNAENLDVSQFNVDSLLGKNIEMGDSSQLGIIMKAESTVPLHVKLIVRCLDDAGNPLKDPEDPEGKRDFIMFDNDTLSIAPPDVTQSGDNWTFTPKQTLNAAHMTKKQLKLFPQTKALHYSIIIDDKSLEEAYKAGLHDVPLGKDGTIKFTIGLTAQIDAAMKLNSNNK